MSIDIGGSSGVLVANRCLFSTLHKWSGSLSSLESDHVEVVKRHVMSVASEDIHETVLINHSGVTVTGSGPHVVHEAKFGLQLVGGMVVCLVEASLLSLLHLVVVHIEALVSVLDDKCVLHRVGDGRGKSVSLTLVIVSGVATTACLLARRSSAVLLHGRSCGGSTMSHAASRAAVSLAGGRGSLLSVDVISFHMEQVLILLLAVLLITRVHGELIGVEIENGQVIQLLGQLTDSTKNVHLGAENNSRVA